MTPLCGVAEIQEDVTDELKKVQKQEFTAVFRNCTTAQKPVYMPMELIFNLKKVMSSSCVFDFFLKVSPKTFRPHSPPPGLSEVIVSIY
jgi:hypothetical protein